MRVLLTGAFGNVGSSALDELLRHRHRVRCFDLRSAANERRARRLPPGAEVVWGDMRSTADLMQAVEDVEVVIHLAFIIPKLSATGIESELEPLLARQVNIGGTRNLIQAMQAQPHPPRFIFSSSLHVYGLTQHLAPPRTANDPLHPVEHYARHKVACEKLLKRSGLTWSILRLAAVLPLSVRPDPGMFDVPLENRIEFVHTRDVGLALANALESEGVWGKTLLIGGGLRGQFTYRQLVGSILETMGIGALPDSAFAKIPFATDWLDTRESEQLLHYQQRTLGDFTRELSWRLGFRRILARLFRPLVRGWLLRLSPYQRRTHSDQWTDKVAVVTGASSGIGRATARRLAREGLKVALVGRRGERLNQLAAELTRSGLTAQAFQADLAEEDHRVRVVSAIRNSLGPIDVLVNNASTAWYGYGAEMDWSVARQMMQVNAAATAHLTLLCLPDMLCKLRGSIINVGSVVGGFPSQGVALYSATKSFIDSFTTAMNRELLHSGVRLGVVRPGYVATELSSGSAGQPGGWRIPGARFAVSAEAVAGAIWSMICRGKRVRYVPRILSLMPWVELSFGWLIDRLGPLLLRWQGNPQSPSI
jgi:UDP-glucose 4-epimerase